MLPSGAPSSAPRDTTATSWHVAHPFAAVAAVLYLVYPFAVHWLVDAGRTTLAVTLSAAALAGACSALPPGRWRGFAFAAVASVLLVTIVGGLAPLVVYVPPIVINLGLAGFFARTLAQGREPLISRFARIERGVLDDELQVYTRRLTWIWVGFFLLMAVVSCALAAGSHAAWLWFTAVGNYVCVAALLVGEYAYRRARFAQYRHASPVELFKLVRAALREQR
jgi:uncharacterized membrane protein